MMETNRQERKEEREREKWGGRGRWEAAENSSWQKTSHRAVGGSTEQWEGAQDGGREHRAVGGSTVQREGA